jgi:hypothetical protein
LASLLEGAEAGKLAVEGELRALQMAHSEAVARLVELEGAAA